MDHVVPFVHLVDAWLVANGTDPASIHTHCSGVSRVFSSDTLLASWIAFHAAEATLRAVCSHCNVTRRRKV
jgi:hypothetical protein